MVAEPVEALWQPLVRIPPTALGLSRVKQVSSLRDEATRPKKEPSKVGKNLVVRDKKRKTNHPSMLEFNSTGIKNAKNTRGDVLADDSGFSGVALCLVRGQLAFF